MIIDIRMVIDVPEKDREKFPEAIEKIIEAVRAEFPDLQVARPHSPVTVFIREMTEAVPS